MKRPSEKWVAEPKRQHNPRLQADAGLHGLASFDPHRLHCLVQPALLPCAAKPPPIMWIAEHELD